MDPWLECNLKWHSSPQDNLTCVLISKKIQCLENVVDRCNYYPPQCVISWLGTVETNQDLIIFSQIYDRLFRLRADAMITSVHGGVNVLLDVNRNHLTSFEFSKFFNQECFTLQRSGSAFMGRYRSAIDILRIAVIPDRRFLRWTCSLCLFSSACPNVSVDLQPGDSPVVPLPSPCARVLGQVALAPSLIRQSACLPAPNCSGTH